MTFGLHVSVWKVIRATLGKTRLFFSKKKETAARGCAAYQVQRGAGDVGGVGAVCKEERFGHAGVTVCSVDVERAVCHHLL